MISLWVVREWFAGGVACLCGFTTGQAFSWGNAALPKIYNGSAGLDLTDDQTAWILISLYIGNIISIIICGCVMNCIGRKCSLLIFCTFIIASWLTIGYFKIFSAMIVARFLAGIWTGVVGTVLPVYIGELVRPKTRGKIATIYINMMYSGALFESLLTDVSYNLLNMISAIPPILLFLAILLLPESQYFYVMKKNHDKARKTIIWLQGYCLEEELLRLELLVEEHMKQSETFSNILTVPSNRRVFIMAILLCIIQRTAGGVFCFNFATIVIPDSWVTAERSFTVICTTLVIGSLFITFVYDFSNRRLLMFVSSTVGTLTMLGNSIWFYLYEETDFQMIATTPWIPLALLVINCFFYTHGILSLSTLLQYELLSVGIKDKASALVSITASLVTIAVIYSFFPIRYYFGLYINFCICFLSNLFGIVVANFMVETRRVISLLELQNRRSARTNSMHDIKKKSMWNSGNSG